MAVPQIAWSDFTWEAFATLATGAAAVGGAVLIGLRQAAIQRRQTDILERQVGLDELKLRSELFDRRFRVYEAARDYLGAIIAHAERPRDRKVENDFLIAVDQARFLFRPKVHEDLMKLYHQTLEFFALDSVMKGTYQAEGHYGDGNPAREADQLTSIANKQMNLAEIFDELRLALDNEPLPPALGPRS